MKQRTNSFIIGAFMVLIAGGAAYATLRSKKQKPLVPESKGNIDLTTVTINIQALKDQKFDFSNDAKTKGDGLAPYDKMFYTLLFSVNNPTSKDLDISIFEIKLTIDNNVFAFVPSEESKDGSPIVVLPKNSTIQFPYKLGLNLADSLKKINWPANEYYKRFRVLNGETPIDYVKTTANDDLNFNAKFAEIISNRKAPNWNIDYKERALASALSVISKSGSDKVFGSPFVYSSVASHLQNYFKNPIEFGKSVKVDITVRLNRSYDVLASKTVAI